MTGVIKARRAAEVKDKIDFSAITPMAYSGTGVTHQVVESNDEDSIELFGKIQIAGGYQATMRGDMSNFHIQAEIRFKDAIGMAHPAEFDFQRVATSYEGDMQVLIQIKDHDNHILYKLKAKYLDATATIDQENMMSGVRYRAKTPDFLFSVDYFDQKILRFDQGTVMPEISAYATDSLPPLEPAVPIVTEPAKTPMCRIYVERVVRARLASDKWGTDAKPLRARKIGNNNGATDTAAQQSIAQAVPATNNPNAVPDDANQYRKSYTLKNAPGKHDQAEHGNWAASRQINLIDESGTAFKLGKVDDRGTMKLEMSAGGVTIGCNLPSIAVDTIKRYLTGNSSLPTMVSGRDDSNVYHAVMIEKRGDTLRFGIKRDTGEFVNAYFDDSERIGLIKDSLGVGTKNAPGMHDQAEHGSWAANHAKQPMTTAHLTEYNRVKASNAGTFCENCLEPNPQIDEDGYTECCNEPTIEKNEAMGWAYAQDIDSYLSNVVGLKYDNMGRGGPGMFTRSGDPDGFKYNVNGKPFTVRTMYGSLGSFKVQSPDFIVNTVNGILNICKIPPPAKKNAPGMHDQAEHTTFAARAANTLGTPPAASTAPVTNVIGTTPAPSTAPVVNTLGTLPAGNPGKPQKQKPKKARHAGSGRKPVRARHAPKKTMIVPATKDMLADYAMKHSPGMHDQSTHGNRYGQDETGNRPNLQTSDKLQGLTHSGNIQPKPGASAKPVEDDGGRQAAHDAVLNHASSMQKPKDGHTADTAKVTKTTRAQWSQRQAATMKASENVIKRSGMQEYDQNPAYTPDHVDALSTYRTSDYRDINTYLRSGSTTGEGDMDEHAAKTAISTLDAAFANAPELPKGIELYRGVGTETAASFRDLTVGDDIVDKAYQSFSYNPTNAQGFSRSTQQGGENVLLRTVTDGKTPGVLIGGSEREVIFDRESQWQITGIQHYQYAGGAGSSNRITVYTVGPKPKDETETQQTPANGATKAPKPAATTTKPKGA